jgi:hypothetical protein
MRHKIHLVQMHDATSDHGPFSTIGAFTTKSCAEAFLEAYYEEARQHDASQHVKKERLSNGELVLVEWRDDGNTIRHWIQTIEFF